MFSVSSVFTPIQDEQLGTGHAVLAAQAVVDALQPQPETVLVLLWHTPLVRAEILAQYWCEHLSNRP